MEWDLWMEYDGISKFYVLFSVMPIWALLLKGEIVRGGRVWRLLRVYLACATC